MKAKHPDSNDKPIRELRADWREIVLVCRKCSKRLGGGFGPKGTWPLAKALRRALALGEPAGCQRGKKAKRRRASVALVEVGCLDVCPKGAVMAVRAAAPGRWLMVPAGRAAADILADLAVVVPEGPPRAGRG